MSSTASTFVLVDTPEPHRIRTRQIVKAHPEVKALMTRTPATALIGVACVAAQVVLAVVLRNQPWYVVALAAYLVGAFFSHTLFVVIHEAAHNLVFRKVWQNVAVGIVANFASVVPTAVSFKNFHIKHHVFQGVHELDADLPDWYEAKLIKNYSVGKAVWLFFFPLFQVIRTSRHRMVRITWNSGKKNYSVGKAVWLFFFPLFQVIRTMRCREVAVFDRFVVANIVAQLAFDAAIVYFFGWMALGYLFLSFWFSVGLHPLGARWIQEHYLTLDARQETYSYYGPLNGINLNVGYHNEHHDMPSIPWNKLPRLKAVAPEFYEPLLHHQSYTKLFFTFLFDQEISLFSRITRRSRGHATLQDNSIPDKQLVEGVSA